MALADVAQLAVCTTHRQPETVVGWHRRGFRLFWTWKSRRRTGRPGLSADVRALIRELSDANPLWGAPRIHGELHKLGIVVSQSTVAKYKRRRPRPPSQSWRTFLTNHAGQVMAADLFVVPTATFRLLFVLVVLAHDRRRIMHVDVTAHPTAGWIAQQCRNAFPEDQVCLPETSYMLCRLSLRAPFGRLGSWRPSSFRCSTRFASSSGRARHSTSRSSRYAISSRWSIARVVHASD